MKEKAAAHEHMQRGVHDSLWTHQAAFQALSMTWNGGEGGEGGGRQKQGPTGVCEHAALTLGLLFQQR